jgi:sugar phosphate isomerase/epimerase
MSIELGLTPDGRWQIETDALISTAAAAGFSALGLSSERADGQARTALEAAGIRCHELLALVFTAEEGEMLSAAAALAQRAGEVGAEWILTVFQAGLDEGAAALLRACAEIFSEQGSKMAVEFSPLGAVRTLREGLEVVEAIGIERSGLLIDTWHFSAGESTWEDLEAVPLDAIAYVQFADALAPESESLGRETMHRRAMPGEGTLELDRFSSILLGRGWEGLVSVEVLSAELRELPVDEFARRAHDAARAFWPS